jgi:hypothetical protein
MQLTVRGMRAAVWRGSRRHLAQLVELDAELERLRERLHVRDEPRKPDVAAVVDLVDLRSHTTHAHTASSFSLPAREARGSGERTLCRLEATVCCCTPKRLSAAIATQFLPTMATTPEPLYSVIDCGVGTRASASACVRRRGAQPLPP